MKHLVNIDLNQNELQNAVIQVLATDPSGVEGQIYYNSTNNVIRYYDGSSWTDLASGGSVNNSNIIINAGNGMTGQANFTLNQSSDETVTFEIGAGNLIDVSATAVSVDLSELTDMTQAFVNTDEFVVLDSSAQRRKAANEINLSVFNNDLIIPSAANDATITISAGDGLQTGGAFTTDQASNETITIDVDSTVVRTSGAQTIAGNKTFSNDVVINGSLDVNGTITTLDTTTLEVGDNEIVLNANVVGTPGLDAGIIVNRGTDTDAKLIWDESTDKWSVDLGTGTTFALATESYVDTNVGGVTAATTITTAQSSPYTFTHSLNATGYIAQTFDAVTGEQLILDITKNGANAVDVSWNGTLTNNVVINVVKTA